MPFSIEMLLDYFEVYNLSIWPMQVLGYVLGLLALVPLVRTGRTWDRVVTGMLAFLWLWIGLVFWTRAARDMSLLYAPAAIFVVQGALFVYALARGRVAYGKAGVAATVIGVVLIAYALAGYPLVGLLVGHVYPGAAISPLFPCPATILTLGALLMATRAPRHLLVIPVFWAIGGALWFSLGMIEDAGLVIAGVVAAVMFIARERASRRSVAMPAQS